MEWDAFKKFFKTSSKPEPALPETHWLEPADNPWGIRMLDVRPVTQTMTSTSSDPECSANAISFFNEDGTCFIGKEPLVSRVVDAHIAFPIDRLLADGVLFNPTRMEEKWAIFYHRHNLIFVRSWTRQVHVFAQVEHHEHHILLTSVQGAFFEETEDPGLTLQILNFLIRTHALAEIFPAPLPPSMAIEPSQAGMWCFSSFGNRAHFATSHPILSSDPEHPLRSNSMLHIAVARGDTKGIETHLQAGIPPDLLSANGQAPLHWALGNSDPGVITRLIDAGSPVDVRSMEGVTPLMKAVETQHKEAMALLIDQGADIHAKDDRGFTALHRAAEMGYLEGVKILLDHGASTLIEAHGHTPLSLAEEKGHAEILALMKGN